MSGSTAAPSNLGEVPSGISQFMAAHPGESVPLEVILETLNVDNQVGNKLFGYMLSQFHTLAQPVIDETREKLIGAQAQLVERITALESQVKQLKEELNEFKHDS
jgi:hypothetical protein